MPGNAERTLRRPAWLARLEAWAVRHRDKLAWLHLAMLVAFITLIVGPLLLPPPGDNATVLNNFTLLTNFLLWGLWFPLVFISVIFTGRSWCGIFCPMGACSEWANRIGPKRPIPAWVRWEGTPVVSFIVVTVLAQTVDARGFAQGAAVVFGLAFLCAVLLGFFYGTGGNKRPWCRHMCPIGLMLGVFSRIGAVQFVAKQPRPGGDAYAEKGLCPTMIHIARKTESRHCIECMRCVQPTARGGLAVVLRPPGQEVAQIRHHNPNATEVWFLFLASGLALGGFLWLVLPQYDTWRQALGEWAIGRGWDWIAMPGPWWLMSVHPAQHETYTWLDVFTISGFMLGTAVALTATLTLLTALSSWLAGRLGGDLTFRARFGEQAYATMPVAMVSLVVGLGATLFQGLPLLGLPAWSAAAAKALLFALGMGWSVRLGDRLLAGEGLRGWRRRLALLPLLAGIVLVALAWRPAIFGY